MNKHKVAIVGYGNIGRYLMDAIIESPDFELVGVVRRNPSEIPPELSSIEVKSSVNELSIRPDVAILSVPTRLVEQYAIEVLNLGINSVDSFDKHHEIVQLRTLLNKTARESGAVAVMSAGWDPGTDSIIRMLLEMAAPQGITHTNFGPGMSMGHTVAAKSVEGVLEALSMTMPLGAGIHRRMVYVELQNGYRIEDIRAQIVADDYFRDDQTVVTEVDSVKALMNSAHGVNLVRRGVSGRSANQRFEFNMNITNPALTAQVMVAAARASFRQESGCYTMVEIPVIDYLPGDREELIAKLV